MAGDHDVGDKEVSNIFRILTAVIKSPTPQASKHCLALIKTIADKSFNIGSATNVEYAVKRLVRGLGSAHAQTQCACFGALTTLLKQGIVDFGSISNAVDKELKIDNDGLALVGCVLANGAVVRSGLYKRLSSENQIRILERLFSDSQAKSYLSSMAMSFITDVLTSSDDNHVENVFWPILAAKLKIHPGDANIDHLYVLHMVSEKQPDIVGRFILKHFTSFSAFYESTFHLICHQKANVDFINSFVKCLAIDPVLLVGLWQGQFGGTAKSTTSKDMTAVTLLASLLKVLGDGKSVPELLTPTIIEVLLRVLAHPIKNTQKKGEKAVTAFDQGKAALRELINLMTKETTTNSTRLKTIKKLLFYPGNVKFEIKTGSRCVQAVIALLSAKYVKKLSETFHKIIYNEESKVVNAKGEVDVWNSKERQQILHMSVKLLSHPKMTREVEWKLNELKFLFNTAFIRGDKLSAEFQKTAKDSFFRAIEVEVTTLEDLLSLLKGLLEHIDEHLVGGAVSLSEEDKLQWDKVMAAIHKLQKKTGSKSFVVVYVLLMHMGVEIFRGKGQVATSVADLLTCYKQIKGKATEGGQEIHWTEVTIDLLLSLLSKEDHLWRHVVACIFPHVVEAMTDTGLHQIIDALDPLSEKNILSHVDSDTSDSEDESEVKSDEDNPDEEDEEEAEEDWTDDEEEKVNDKLRMAVREALGYSAALTDEESVDMDEMDEVEQKRLNQKLADAFRQFKGNTKPNKKAKQSKEDEALTHFRNRVLDLVEIYVSKTPSMSGCMDLILPLFSLLEAAIKDHHQKPFQNRLESILRKLSDVRKFRNLDNVDNNVLLGTFRAVVYREGVGGLMYVEMSPRISDMCTFLLRCSQSLPEQEDQEESGLEAEYKKLITSYFTARDSRLPVSLFLSALRMVWSGNWTLVECLYNFLLDDKLRIMRKQKVLQLLVVFYNNDRLHSTASKKQKKMLTKSEIHFAEKFVSLVPFYDKAMKEFMLNFVQFVKLVFTSSSKYRKEKSGDAWKQVVLEVSRNEALASGKTKNQLLFLAVKMDIELPKATNTKGIAAVKSEKLGESQENGTSGDQEEVKPADQTKKKKKRKAKSGALKKESRNLRLAASSLGLESVPFSFVKNSFEGVDEVQVKKGEKRKNVKELNSSKSKKKK